MLPRMVLNPWTQTSVSRGLELWGHGSAPGFVHHLLRSWVFKTGSHGPQVGLELTT